jgi:hypothetical protein
VNAKDSILEKRLRSEKPHFATSAGFTDRLMDHLPARPIPLARGKQRPLTLRLVMGLAVAACIALVLLQLLPRHPQLAAPATLSRNEVEPVQQLNLPSLSVEQVQAVTAKLDEPLQTELKNVISDARQAIQLIASNFLPEN